MQAVTIAALGFALLIASSSAQILQTAAPAPQAAVPSAGNCMSGQPAGQLTNAGTGTVSVTSDVATVPFLPTLSSVGANCLHNDVFMLQVCCE